jgi:teichuronic acid biosynthesis glycosyltransferase TuaC
MIFVRRQAGSVAALNGEVEIFFLRSRTSAFALAREFIRFRRAKRRFLPDVIHAHYGTVTALFAACGHGSTPLVITYRGSDLNPPSPTEPWRARLRAEAGRLFSQVAALAASRLVCVSQQLKRRLWWRRNRVTILASGVDRAVFRPEPRAVARHRLGWNDTDRVILFHSGRGARVKRLDLARAGAELARQRIPSARMELLEGSIDPDRVPDLMNAADCLLVTSDYEGSPTVVQEALACNLPVVSVEVGDIRERLCGVSHARIVERDPQRLGAALVEILDIPQRSDGRRRVNEFCSTAIARQLLAIYSQAAHSQAAHSQAAHS